MSAEQDKPLYLQHSKDAKPAEGALPFESVPFKDLVRKAKEANLEEPEGGWTEADRKTLYNLTSLGGEQEKTAKAEEAEKQHAADREKFLHERAEQKAELEIKELLKVFRSRLMGAWKVLFELAKGNTNVDVKGALMTIITMYWQMSSLQGRTKAEKIAKIKEFLVRSEPEMAAIEEQVRQYELQRGETPTSTVKLEKEQSVSELAKAAQDKVESQMRQYGVEQGVIFDEGRYKREHPDEYDLAA